MLRFAARILPIVFLGTIVTLLSSAIYSAPLPGQAQTGLKIAVLAGEDSVNIIQRNTAVQPIVEVRDANNLPVSGATVQFSMPATGAGGTFANGQRIVSVTTDALGRAASAEMRLQGVGTFRVQVTASYQGQTATTTIGQTNFATAADAAAAGRQASSLSSGASGSAGGMSTAAATGIAAGAGAAGVVAETSSSDECSSSASTFIDSVTSTLKQCQNSNSPQCKPAVQTTLNHWGQVCTCVGGDAGVQFALTQFGFSQEEYSAVKDEAIAEAKNQGLTLPASCKF